MKQDNKPASAARLMPRDDKMWQRHLQIMERAQRADPVIAAVMEDDGFHKLVAQAVTQVNFKEIACQLEAAHEATPTVSAGALLKDIVLERWEQRVCTQDIAQVAREKRRILEVLVNCTAMLAAPSLQLAAAAFAAMSDTLRRPPPDEDTLERTSDRCWATPLMKVAWKRIGPALQRRGMLEAIDAVDDTAAGRVILDALMADLPLPILAPWAAPSLARVLRAALPPGSNSTAMAFTHELGYATLGCDPVVLDFMPWAAGLLHFCSLHMRDKPALLAAPGLLEAAVELTGVLHDLAFGPDQTTGHFGKPRAPFSEALRQCCQALMAIIASRDIVARRPMEIPEPEAANMLRVVVSLLAQPMADPTNKDVWIGSILHSGTLLQAAAKDAPQWHLKALNTTMFQGLLPLQEACNTPRGTLQHASELMLRMRAASIFCRADAERGQGRTEQELRGRLSMLVVLLGRMTHALDAAAGDRQLRARLKALPSMAVMEDYPDGRIRDTVRGHLLAAADWAADALATTVYQLAENQPRKRKLAAAEAIVRTGAADTLLRYLLREDAFAVQPDLPKAVHAGNDAPDSGAIVQALAAVGNWVTAEKSPRDEASDALATATAAAALAVLTSAQSTSGLEYCGPQYEFGFAGSQGTVMMSGESIRRIMLSHMLLHTLIAHSSRTARLTADQGAVAALLAMLQWLADRAGGGGHEFTVPFAMLPQLLAEIAAAEPRCAADLAAGGQQRMKTVYADVQRKLQPDARACVSRSMGAALKDVDATVKAVPVEAAANAGAAPAPPGSRAMAGGDGGAAAAAASFQQMRLADGEDAAPSPIVARHGRLQHC